jgi:hypothetical protein
MKFVKIPLLCLCLLFANITNASVNYTIKLETNPSEKATTNQDIAIAFKQLINDLTGTSIKKGLTSDQLLAIVEQYQYSEEQGRQYLIVDFDKKAVTNYLKNHNLDSGRTMENSYLLFAAEQTDNHQKILDPDTNAILLNTISQQAHKEGLELVSPTMDLEDLAAVQFADIWQHHYDTLLQVAKRYKTKGILVLKLSRKSGDDWHSDWQLYKNNRVMGAKASNAPIRNLTHEAIQEIKEQLEQNTNDAPSSIYVQVNQINSNENYQAIFKTLKKIPGVLQVQLDGVTPDSVLYKLSVETDKETLIQNLKGHKSLIIEPGKEIDLLKVHIRP